MTVSDEFTGVTSQYRRELLAHCYRMLGSADEAEDLVQETLLRAWRSFEEFEGRSSVRTWLYRIATNVCLTAIDKRRRRPLPSGLGVASGDPYVPLEAAPDVSWLQPLPSAMANDGNHDPAVVAARRSGVRLAFVAALQHLTARQRAMLILRDVLQWPVPDVADLLGTTPTAVYSGVLRARAQLARIMPAEDDLAEPADAEQRALLERFAAAVEGADSAALAELLRADAVLEMPPFLTWFAGRDAVMGFVDSYLLEAPGGLFLVPTAANGQAAFAVYRREGDGTFRAHAVQVLTQTSAGISRIVAFADPSLFASFGMPLTHQGFDASGSRP